MTFVTLTTRVAFDAAHHHPDPAAGKCSRVHGHTYQVLFELMGKLGAEGEPEGMAYDLSKVRSWWRGRMDPLLDHHDLNEVLPQAYQPPTIEHLALYLLTEAQDAGIPCSAVTVQEGQHHTARVAASIPARRTQARHARRFVATP